MILLFIFIGSRSQAKVIRKAYTDEQAIRAVVGEASAEGYYGMKLVASAIRNRGHLRGVYGFSAQHIKHENKDTWKLARHAWYSSANENIARGADCWYSQEDLDNLPQGVPSDRKFLFQYKNHYFYKLTKNKRRKT